MRYLPRPGSYIRRHENRAGDPLDGLINLFDLSLVLAVGFLVAGFSAIGALDLLAPQNPIKPLTGAPPTEGGKQNGQGQEVGTVYKLQDGRYVFQPNQGAAQGFPGGATGGTGATGGSTAPPTNQTSPGTGSIPPASTTPTPSAGGTIRTN